MLLIIIYIVSILETYNILHAFIEENYILLR